MGSDLNPASIADSRYKFDIVLFSGYFGAYQNHMYFNTRKMPYWWVKSFDDNDPKSHDWLNNGDLEKLVSVDSTNYYKSRGLGQMFEIDNGDKNRSVFANTEFDVLNFMVTLSRKRAISFQIRSRSILNIDDASPELIRFSTNDWNFENLFNKSIQDEEINLSMNSWIEYNLGYAQILSDKNQHFFKVGGKLKFLQGVASAYLHADDLTFDIQNDTTANSISANFDYGYSENLGGFIEPDNGNEEFGGNDVTDFASKLGLGVDMGIVYEWRPDWEEYKYDMDGETNLWRRSKNKYKLRVGAALNDIGGMRYEKGGASNNFSLQTGIFDLQNFDDTEGLRSLDSTLQTFADSGWVTFNGSDDRQFYMNLPTHINLDVDYHIYKNFYINAYSRINMKFGNDENTVHYPTSVAITPRFDHRYWGVSMPLSYNGTAGFRTGLALRLDGVLIGTGDLKPLLAPGKDWNVRGLDIFIGARIPILYKEPKDRDKDGVSDKLDECIDIPGIWALKGCSDVDNDGVLDQNDSCVTDSGLVKFDGCPDKDGDDIIDKIDDCPDEPGIPEFNGCPDTDGDGIMNKLDSCPEFPGPKINKGCPLKMLHSIDSMGTILETDTMFHGEEYYYFENLKSDNSQLFMLGQEDDSEFIRVILGNDTITAFKNDKGYFYYKYLPPDEPIEIELMAEEEEILKRAFDNLEFETGKAKIKESSYASLEDLAKLLLQKPEWKIRISGHTDNVGNDNNNMKLSKNRAEAVKDFLILNDVFTERINVEWFGETKPIADNDTKEGRQKNRRVEMKIE